MRALSLVVASGGHLFIAVRGLLTITASLVAEHRLQMRRLSNCGSRAQLLRGMWDLPRPGLEPTSPALAGRFSTTAPPGKPLTSYILFYPIQFFSEEAILDFNGVSKGSRCKWHLLSCILVYKAFLPLSSETKDNFHSFLYPHG